jgi:hypothetical protein
MNKYNQINVSKFFCKANLSCILGLKPREEKFSHLVPLHSERKDHSNARGRERKGHLDVLKRKVAFTSKKAKKNIFSFM